MNAAEYVSKGMQDKQFMATVVSNLPDNVLRMFDDENSGIPTETPAALMAFILNAAAPGVGVQASKQEIESECVSQCPGGRLKAVGMLVKIGRVVKKEMKKRGM